MNKIYTSVIASILLLFCFFSAQAFTPTLSTSRLDTGTIHPCDTIHNQVIVRDTSSTSHQDTLFIYLNANVLNFTAYSLSGSLPVFYSAGIAKIYIDTAIDTIINYSYYIPCSIIPSSNTPTAINCNEIIRYVHVHTGINFYSSSYILNIPFGYYNLFYNPTPTVPSNFSIAGRIGQRLVRTITLNSTGLNSTGFDGYLSLTDSISNACDMYVIDSLIVDRVNSFGIRNNITTNYYSIPVIPSNTPFYYSPFIHLNALSNEHLEIREVIHIQAAGSNTCIDNCLRHQIENKFEINYGCDTLLLCKNISLNATIYKTSNTLSLADSIISSVMNWDTACFQNPLFSSLPTTSQLIHHTHFVKNKGNSIAYQVQLILTSKNKTSEVILPYWTSTNYRSSTIAADSIQYYYPSLTSAANLPTCINSFRNLIPLNETDSCSPINEISWTFPELTVGEIVQIDYYTYRCCPNDTDKYVGNFTAATYYDTWNLNGHLDGIDQDNHAAARDECGFTIYLEQASKYGIVKTEMLTGSILGPAHLTGTNGICDTTKTVYYEIPLSQFCDGISTARNEDLLAALSGGSLQGQLLVDISTDYGLNPIPMGSRLISLESSIATGSITRVANLLGAGSYSGAGGNIQVSFNLDTLHADTSLSTYANLISFINGAYFRFPITPCCNGLAKPLINVKFYIVPKLGSNTCYYCKIPLSAKTRAIELHCPGCVTPGIIADNCKVRRITTGYPDNNNNGLADIGTPYAHIDSIHLNRYAGSSFMPGDEISLYLEGYGQDGDNNGGFDYATLQDYWDSLHSVHPSYPVGFTYVYILIKNACAASSSFNWQVLSDTFYLHRGNVDTSFSLHPFETSTGHYHLYRVPVSSLFDTLSMNDQYKVKIKYKACANGSPATCNISSYMWWSATSLHDSLTQIHYPIIGDTIDFYKDSVLIQRIEHADTAFVYQCEAHGDQINAFALKKEIKYVWKNSAHPDFPTSTTCDKMLTTNYKLKLISEVANQVNLFPYEYRPLQPDFIYDITERPSGLAPTYIVSNINTNSIYKNWLAGTTQITNSLVGSNSVAGLYNYYQLATTKNIVVETSLPAATSPYFVQGDEQNEININYTYSPTVCATPDSTIAIKENTNKAVVKSQYCSDVFDTAQNIDNATIFLRNPNPTLILNLVRTTVDVYSVDPTCFAVQFRNGNSREHLAENVWLHIVNPSAGGHIWSVSELSSSAGVNIDSVRSDGDSGLIAYINHLNSNQSIDLQICFDVNSCIRPSNIQLIYGYSCVDSIACFIDSTQIQLQIAEALILPIAAHLPDTMTTCIADTIDASFEVQEAGEIDHLTVGVNLPVGVNIQAAILSYSRLADTPIVSAALGFVRVDTIIAGRQYIRFLLAADTVLHGPNSSEYSSIWIHIRFIIGSCISSSFSPTIYLQGQSYCNGIETDSITNGMIHVVYSADSCLPVSVVLDSINHTTCNGVHSGAIRIKRNIIIDSPGSITYLWNTGDTGIRIRNLDAGTYTVTATDGYGCSDTASFTILALSNPILLPSISYQPYTTCDLRADSIVIVPYLPTPPTPLPLPYIPPIPRYTYTWTASNIDSLFPDTGTFIGGTSYRHVIPIHFADSLVGSTIIIRATDSNGCYDELRIWIEPCCVRSDANIINSGKLSSNMYIYRDTVLIDTYFNIVSKLFRINGILEIDTNTKILSSIFYMEKGSMINIKAGKHLYLHSCTFVACDSNMWQGFIIDSGGLLTTGKFSRIYDADTAIVCKKKSQYNIEQTYFNRNLVCLSVHPNSLSINPSTIIASNLYCHTESPAYYGNVIPDAAGTLWYPHKGEKTNYGIYVRNNLQLQVGDSILGWEISKGSSIRNKFENMFDGIYSENSNIQVKNNDFHDMRRNYEIVGLTMAFKRGNAIEHINDSTNLSYMAGLRVQHCKMDSIENACISLNGKYIFDTIEFNIMNGYFGIIGNNLGNNTTKPNYSNTIIRFNTINFGKNNYRFGESIASTSYCGILLNACKKVYAQIGFNKITSNITLNTSKEIGIKITGLGVVSNINPRFMINNNKIYSSYKGIHIADLTTPIDTSGCIRLPGDPPCPIIYYGDTIQYDSIFSLNPKANASGIYLNNAHSINIKQNYLKGTISGNAKKGIELNIAKSNYINCNTIEYFTYSIHYSSLCNMPNRLYGNSFKNANYFLYAFNSTATIGNQELVDDGTAAGTTMFPANTMNSKATIQSIKGGTGPFNWKFLNLPNFYNPSHSSVTTFLPTGVSFFLSTYTPYSCPLPVFGGGGSGTLLPEDTTREARQLLLNAIVIDAMNEPEVQGEKLMNEEYLYDLIKTNPELLLVNDSLQAYFESKQIAHVGAMDEIKETIYNENYIDADTKLDILITNDFQEEVNKATYTIQNNLEQRGDGILELEELETLQLIANYCPIRYGAAVYLARTLINSQKGYEAYYWEDEEICIEGINYKRNNIDEIDLEQIIDNPNIEIHPNPATQNVYYNIIDKDKNKCNNITGYILKDIAGRVVKKEMNEQLPKSGNIDISNYPEGLYFLYFKCVDESYTLCKFVINR